MHKSCSIKGFIVEACVGFTDFFLNVFFLFRSLLEDKQEDSTQVVATFSVKNDNQRDQAEKVLLGGN